MNGSEDLGPLEPLVEAVLKKVADVAIIGACVVDGRITDQKPAHVAPEKARARAMRVARLIRMLMVHAVDRNPLHWGALTAAGAQERQAVFQQA